MASGVPVVATDVGAFPEIVTTGDQGAGLLIARDDLDAMAKPFRNSWMMKPAATARSQCTGACQAENFRIEGEATKLKAVYDSLG